MQRKSCTWGEGAALLQHSTAPLRTSPFSTCGIKGSEVESLNCPHLSQLPAAKLWQGLCSRLGITVRWAPSCTRIGPRESRQLKIGLKSIRRFPPAARSGTAQVPPGRDQCATPGREPPAEAQKGLGLRPRSPLRAPKVSAGPAKRPFDRSRGTSSRGPQVEL